ncbi:zinc finger protein zat5, partial [Phtheirospermum japonicum]
SPIYIYECKTCSRTFPSLQALGDHRASHKKPKTTIVANKILYNIENKSKFHECSICRSEIASGQAFGGHMRRHRSKNRNNIDQWLKYIDSWMGTGIEESC